MHLLAACQDALSVQLGDGGSRHRHRRALRCRLVLLEISRVPHIMLVLLSYGVHSGHGPYGWRTDSCQVVEARGTGDGA